jgi:hypothetical protein
VLTFQDSGHFQLESFQCNLNVQKIHLNIPSAALTFWVLLQSTRKDMARAFYITIFPDPWMCKYNRLQSHKIIHKRRRKRDKGLKERAHVVGRCNQQVGGRAQEACRSGQLRHLVELLPSNSSLSPRPYWPSSSSSPPPICPVHLLFSSLPTEAPLGLPVLPPTGTPPSPSAVMGPCSHTSTTASCPNQSGRRTPSARPPSSRRHRSHLVQLCPLKQGREAGPSMPDRRRRRVGGGRDEAWIGEERRGLIGGALRYFLGFNCCPRV